MSVLPYDNGQQRLMPVPLDASARHYDSFLLLERQARQLQHELQSLLDAQSAGLAAGLSGRPDDDILSNGSLTPTPSSVQFGSPRNAITIPVRQPPKKKVGLRGARRGILKKMNALLTLKEEEHQIIGSELADRRTAIREVDTFVNKQNGLVKTISDIQNKQGKSRAENLQREARSLEADIEEMETMLLQMKARYRHILNEVSQIQNSVDAQLSSYQASLALVKTDASKYLRSLPIQPLVAHSATPPPFYALNPKRRTLEMAKEQWITEQSELRNKRRKVDAEIQALREGGGVWQKVISEIGKFEKLLWQEMQRSVHQELDSSKPHGQTVLRELKDTTTQLETSLQLAEQKNWNLLICSIGAELEAFREAKQLLLETFPALMNQRETDGSTSKGKQPDRDSDGDVSTTNGEREDPNESPLPGAEEKSAASLSPIQSSTRSDEDEDEDAEPDPAWLLS
ncbi:hypothetical protein FQN52_003659 [Onygenales sp. PD_12]|nr:hypothetical protein FQN52_003659 [Onygenales sp. PD_12]